MKLSKAEQDKIQRTMKRLYGRHLKSIHKYRRKSPQDNLTEFSIICDEHGVIMPWTIDKHEARQAMLDHLKGLYD